MGSGTNIGRVRGLGSAQEGAHHWIMQRVTAVSNLLLVLWLVFSLIRLPQFEHALMIEWLALLGLKTYISFPSGIVKFSKVKFTVSAFSQFNAICHNLPPFAKSIQVPAFEKFKSASLL